MSEDEEDLVGNIIKVVISRKFDCGEVEICHSADSRKRVLPKIVVTDHCEYDITDLFQDAEEEYLSLQYRHNEETDRNGHLDIGNEFQAEPRDLLPDSYLSYMGSCQSLMGHISQYSQLRVSAEDWIEQFDKEIDEAIRLAEAEEEKEREERRREEERRLRLERRRLIRKINQPLLNKTPHPGGGGSQSSHSRVCQLPLLSLKRMLRKYQPKLDYRFSKNNRQLESFFAYISTSEALELLRTELAIYLNDQRNLAAKCPLNLQGKRFEALKIPKKVKENEKTPHKDEKIKQSYKIEDINEIIAVSRKEAFPRISFQELLKEERQKLRGNISKSQRIHLKRRRKISLKGSTADHDIFFPNSRQNGRKFPQKENENKKVKSAKNFPRNIMRIPVKNKAVIHIFIPKLENLFVKSKLRNVSVPQIFNVYQC